MSSLTSSTKVPQQSKQVVYYVPSNTAETGGASTDTQSDGTTDASSTSETASKAREQNLLTRERGALGTIRTGFKGLLSTIETTGKSLLGQ